MLRVLLIVQQLLQENKHGSKRDIYYMHPSVFRGDFNQKYFDYMYMNVCDEPMIIHELPFEIEYVVMTLSYLSLP